MCLWAGLTWVRVRFISPFVVSALKHGCSEALPTSQLIPTARASTAWAAACNTYQHYRPLWHEPDWYAKSFKRLQVSVTKLAGLGLEHVWGIWRAFLRLQWNLSQLTNQVRMSVPLLEAMVALLLANRLSCLTHLYVVSNTHFLWQWVHRAILWHGLCLVQSMHLGSLSS